MFDPLLQDLRFTLRTLRKRPFFFLIPVLSLSIGIGANTTIFSAVKRFLLSPPEGIPNASMVVELGRGWDGHGFDSFSYPDFLDLRQDATPLEALAGYEMQMLTLSQEEAGERVFGMLVSANYFDLLGVRPYLGRTFLPEEDEGWNEHPVVVLSYDYWKSRLGSDPEVVGSTLYVSRKPYTVVGIAPEGFRGHMVLANTDAYLPLMQSPSLNEGRNWSERRGSSWLQVLGLLRSGATVQEADAAAATVSRRLAEEYPETNARKTVSVKPFGALPGVIRGPAGVFLEVLLAFVGLILLITCANVAGIFLARAVARKKEVAIRLSVGSGRSRLIGHFLTESSLVFLSGGIGGILLTAWGLDAVSSFDLPAPFPVQLDLAADGAALAFAAVLTLGTGLLFGLVPAREALKLDLLSTLKDEGGRRGTSESRWRRSFVTGQVGASLVLLVAAGLLLRALQHAGEIETGFVAEGAYLTFLDLETEGVAPAEGGVFQDEVLDFFSRQSWVDEVSLALDLPLDLSAHGTGVVPEGWEGTGEREYLGVDFNAVSPAYFSTLRIPVLAGRVFQASDREGSERVAVVSRTFAERASGPEGSLGTLGRHLAHRRGRGGGHAEPTPHGCPQALPLSASGPILPAEWPPPGTSACGFGSGDTGGAPGAPVPGSASFPLPRDPAGPIHRCRNASPTSGRDPGRESGAPRAPSLRDGGLRCDGILRHPADPGDGNPGGPGGGAGNGPPVGPPGRVPPGPSGARGWGLPLVLCGRPPQRASARGEPPGSHRPPRGFPGHGRNGAGRDSDPGTPGGPDRPGRSPAL